MSNESKPKKKKQWIRLVTLNKGKLRDYIRLEFVIRVRKWRELIDSISLELESGIQQEDCIINELAWA